MIGATSPFKPKKVNPAQPKQTGLIGMSAGVPDYLKTGPQGDLGGEFRTRLENAFFQRQKNLLQPELDKNRESAISDFRARGLAYGTDDFNKQYKSQVTDPTSQAYQNMANEAILNSGQEFDRYSNSIQGQQRLGLDKYLGEEANRLTGRGQDLDFRAATRGQDINKDIANLNNQTTRDVESGRLKLGFAEMGSREKIADKGFAVDREKITSGENVAKWNIGSNEKIAELGEKSAMDRLRESNQFTGRENQFERDSRAALNESTMGNERAMLNRRLDAEAGLNESRMRLESNLLDRRLNAEAGLNESRMGTEKEIARMQIEANANLNQMQQNGAMALEEARQRGDREAAAALFQSQKVLQEAKGALDRGNVELSNRLQLEAERLQNKFTGGENRKNRKFDERENKRNRSLQERLAALSRGGSGGGGGGSAGPSDEFIDALYP